MQGKNVLYYNLQVDRRSVSQMRALISQLDAIIDELFTSALKSVQTGNLAEYELDTGQTKTRIKYTSVTEVTKSIESFENLRKLYLNQIENKVYGRTTQLVDQSNFRNG
jgi:hypothetical protein